MSIHPDSIALVRDRADIVTEIGSRMQLRKSGANHLGLCPFHGEKTPSFTVNAAKQFFHCFGCGAHGDVIEFLKLHDGMSFAEAVESLAERTGVRLEHDKPHGERDMVQAQRQRERAQLLERSCEDAQTAYAQQLQASPQARDYVRGRGLSAETIETYGLGYAPAAGRLLPRSDPQRATLLAQAGLLIEAENGHFERFRDRLMFPIRDARGRVIAFGGRWIASDHDPGKEPPAKYLNSPETAIFHKQAVLYGLHEARAHIMRQKMAFVVEGYMDVVMLAQHGVGNAVAAMGTALTAQQLQLLLRFTNRVCIVFDGDAAGRKAARKSLETALPLLESEHAISFLTLPDNLDPDEFVKERGQDRFLEMAKAAPTLSQFMLASLVTDFGAQGRLPTPEAKAQFSAALAALLAQMKPGNRLRGLIEQEARTLIAVPGPGGAQPYARSAALSPADRLRQLNQSRRNDRLIPVHGRTPTGGESGFGQPAWRNFAPAPPAQHQHASLWSRLYDAAAIAPEQARAVAEQVLPLLDEQSPEEFRLAGFLEMLAGTDTPHQPSPASQERTQAAADLLASALRLIERQRAREVEEELLRMRRAGEIDEKEFMQHLLALPR